MGAQRRTKKTRVYVSIVGLQIREEMNLSLQWKKASSGRVRETKGRRERKESARAPASNAHACTRETGEEEVDSNE